MSEEEAEASNRIAEHKEAKKRRQGGKTLNFGAAYGSGPKTVSENLNIPIEEAANLLDLYWNAYPQMAESMNRYGNLANKYGYSNTVLGRRRYYTDILEKIRRIRSQLSPKDVLDKMKEHKMEWLLKEGEKVTDQNLDYLKKRMIGRFKGDINRQAGNQHIQGTAADMTKLAAIKVKKVIMEKNLDAKLVGLIHDEVIVESNKGCLKEMEELTLQCMTEAFTHFCPTVNPAVDGKCSPHWLK